MVNRLQRHKIKRLLPKEYYRILFCAIITNLFLTNEDTHRLVDSKFSGALAFTYCLTNKHYYLKLVDIKGHSGVLWQSLFNPDSKYTRDNLYLHTFKVSKLQHYQSAGFVFYNEDDARRFYKRVINRHKYVQKSFESENKNKSAPLLTQQSSHKSSPLLAQQSSHKSSSLLAQQSLPASHLGCQSKDVSNIKLEQQHTSHYPPSSLTSTQILPTQNAGSQIVSPQLSVDESINLISHASNDEIIVYDHLLDLDQGPEILYLSRYVQLDSQIDKIIPRRHDHKSKKPSELQLFKANKKHYKKPMMHKEPSYIQTKSRSSYYDYNNNLPNTQILQTTAIGPNQLAFADDDSISQNKRKNTLVARYKDLAEMPQCVRKSVILIEDNDEHDHVDMTAIINKDPGICVTDDLKKEKNIKINSLFTPNSNEFEFQKPQSPAFSDSRSPIGTSYFFEDINSEKNTIRSGIPKSPTASQSSSASTKTAINNVNAMLSMVGTQLISQRDTPTRFSMHKHMNHDKELFPEIFKFKNSVSEAVSLSNIGSFERVGSLEIISKDSNKISYSLSDDKLHNSIANDESNLFESRNSRNNSITSLVFNVNRLSSISNLRSLGLTNISKKRNLMFEKRDLQIIQDVDETTTFDTADGTTDLIQHGSISTLNFASTSAISFNDEKSSFGKLSRKISVRMPKLDQLVSGPKKRLSFLQKKGSQNVKQRITSMNPRTSENDIIIVATNGEEINTSTVENFRIEEIFDNKTDYGSSFTRILSRKFSGYQKNTNNTTASSKYNSNNKKNLQISAPIPVEILEVDELVPESPMDDFIGYKHRHNSSVSSSSGVSEFTESNLFLSVR